MKRSTLLWTLAILNAVLLVGLSWKLGAEPAAYGQARARGDYVMVPAKIPGANSGIIFMVDTRNGLLTGFAYDHNNKAFDVMPPIDLNRVLGGGAGVGGGRVIP